MDVLQILEKLQELGFIRLHKVSGDYYQIYCPIHSGGNEKKPSCGVLLKDQIRNGQKYPAGWVHCFSCGYVNTISGLISDILKSKNITMSGLEWLQTNIPGFQVDSFEYLVPKDLMQSVSSKYAVEYIQKLSKPEVNYISEEELASYRYTVPYMYERGLTDDLIVKFDVGYDANWIPPGRKNPAPCITFPVRNKFGKTLFLCRRVINYKMYNYPEGVEKPLYGIDMIPKGCNELMIVESCINALTCWKYGHPAVALMGTGNSLQVHQLKELGVSNIVLAMDGDDAGRRASEKLKRALKSCSIVWTMHLPDGKDVNDLKSLEEFNGIYSNRD